MFPCGQDVQLSGSLVRQVSIPTTFTSVAVYKNIMTASITGRLPLFPCGEDVQLSSSLVRQVTIPITFKSIAA